MASRKSAAVSSSHFVESFACAFAVRAAKVTVASASESLFNMLPPMNQKSSCAVTVSPATDLPNAGRDEIRNSCASLRAPTRPSPTQPAHCERSSGRPALQGKRIRAGSPVSSWNVGKSPFARFESIYTRKYCRTMSACHRETHRLSNAQGIISANRLRWTVQLKQESGMMRHGKCDDQQRDRTRAPHWHLFENDRRRTRRNSRRREVVD